MGQGFLPNMCPGIFHGQGRAAVQHPAPYADLRPLRCVKRGIGKQIPHGFSEQGGVSRDEDPRRQGTAQGLAALLKQLSVQHDLAMYQGGQLHALLFDRYRAGFHAGDRQHLLDQALHPARHPQRAQ